MTLFSSRLTKFTSPIFAWGEDVSQTDRNPQHSKRWQTAVKRCAKVYLLAPPHRPCCVCIQWRRDSRVKKMSLWWRPRRVTRRRQHIVSRRQFSSLRLLNLHTLFLFFLTYFPSCIEIVFFNVNRKKFLLHSDFIFTLFLSD